MPKLKTKKTISKRVRLTKTGKIKTIKAGQNHFNARERGNTTRNKRRDHTLSGVNTTNIKKLMPYS
ncbi:MAG: 50S ribosomal protein L35 [Candidatus Komeilibacteria bacterium]|nr:50S ribosomal protein L35 [Candidatus Komeilibacteria bacterium]